MKDEKADLAECTPNRAKSGFHRTGHQVNGTNEKGGKNENRFHHSTSLFCEHLAHEGGHNGADSNQEADEVVPDAT